MQNIDLCTSRLKAAIMASDEYKVYLHYLELIKREPQLFDMVNSIRRKAYAVTNNADLDENGVVNEYNKFKEEYNYVKSNDLARKFLDAELIVCRIFQDINYKLMEDLDFDVDFMNY